MKKNIDLSEKNPKKMEILEKKVKKQQKKKLGVNTILSK
jgi:hypothetical protein